MCDSFHNFFYGRVKKIYLLPGLLFFILYPALFPVLHSQQLRFKTVSPSLLGDTDMEYIFFSKSGRMWFGSARGLTSFDGSRTTFYNKLAEVPILGNALISCIAEDSKNNFWIGTHHKGVNYFESQTGRFTKIYLRSEEDSTERNIHVQDIFIESDSSVWIATTRFGFFIYNPVNGRSRHFNLDINHRGVWNNTSRNTPKSFARDPENRDKIWIGAYDGIYSCHSSGAGLKKEFVISTGIKEDEEIPRSFCRIQKIHLSGNDTIWFSTWGKGMGYCDIKSGRSRLFPQNETKTNALERGLVIVNFCPKSKHEFYVASRNYLPGVFNTQTGRYNFIQDEEMNKSSSNTYNIVEGYDSSLWICKGGLLYFHSPVHSLFNEFDVSAQLVPATAPNLMREVFWNENENRYYCSIDTLPAFMFSILFSSCKKYFLFRHCRAACHIRRLLSGKHSGMEVSACGHLEISFRFLKMQLMLLDQPINYFPIYLF